MQVLLLWVETSKLAQKLAKLYISQWLKGLFNISSHISIIVIFASWKFFELLKNYAKMVFWIFSTVAGTKWRPPPKSPMILLIDKQNCPTKLSCIKLGKIHLPNAGRHKNWSITSLSFLNTWFLYPMGAIHQMSEIELTLFRKIERKSYKPSFYGFIFKYWKCKKEQEEKAKTKSNFKCR